MKNMFSPRIYGLFLLLVFFVLALSLLPRSLQADIINGGFENGFDSWNITHWNCVNLNTDEQEIITSPSDAPEGQNYAHFGVIAARNGDNDISEGHIWMRQEFYANSGEQLLLQFRSNRVQIFLYGPIFVSCADISFRVFGGGGNYGEQVFGFSETHSEWEELSFPAFETDGYYWFGFDIDVAVLTGVSNPGEPYPWELLGVLVDLDNIHIIPEPSCIIYLGVGTISLLAYFWRRRKSAA